MSKVEEKTIKVLEFVQTFSRTNGFPPTIREIQNALGITSTSLVHSYLQKLSNEGKIEKQVSKNRAIYPASLKNSQYTSVPLVGTVSAGKGILAIENIEDYFPLPSKLFHGNNLFMLRVDGDSMIEAGISDGDTVVVKQSETAENGDIIVALMDEVATVKRFFRHPDFITLHPENATMQDIIIESGSPLCILGIVVGCIKQFV